ncbi:Zinc finger, UBP-type [Dillenia turbinata]|uniref:Zinc finger, UBP-type n=1 Tax=Dillenia turbinata TaxID=194707 RepID=A0AAN8W5H2_9MAGN
MFALRVHSVDAPQPVPDDGFTPITATTTATSNPSPNFLERKGVLHLYRPIISLSPSSSSPNPNPNRNSLLFVVAIPNYVSSSDFIRFCEMDVAFISELVIIRNDALEDRYSALIKFVDQLRADNFFRRFNGKKFSFAEAEVCHLLYMHSVEYTKLAEVAGTPPAGFTELPTCPRDWIKMLVGYRLHFVIILFIVCRFCQQQEEKPTCSVCGTSTSENIWVCVICGFVGCGRYKEGHAVKHWTDTQHSYSLHLDTQRVWDYVGDRYVHRLNQSRADGKMGLMNYDCLSLEGDCGTCGCSEDSGISGALYDSKVEAILDEYNRLLATQMEAQRKNYESLILEAKSKREAAIAEAVENAVASKMLDMQHNLEKNVEERNAAADLNLALMKNQEVLRQKYKEIEEREILSLKEKDEKILDLKEQVRDLKLSLEFRRTLDNISDSDGGIEGVTVLPGQSPQSPRSNTRRHSKSNRRRS